MSWQDELTETGRFRGVEFYVRSHNASGGRRNVKREYPFRDLPAVEDLGRKGRGYNVEMYVIGADYMGRRNALLNALDLGGAGELYHPWLGLLRVNVESWTLEEGNDRNGWARFSVSFLEAGAPLQPSISINSAEVVTAFADAGQAESAEELAEEHQPEELSDWSLGNLIESIVEVGNKLKDKWEAVSTAVGNAVDMAERIYGQVQAFVAQARTGFGLASLVDRVRNAGDLISGEQSDTAEGRRLARSRSAIGQTIRLSMIFAVARRSAEIEPTSQVEARAMLEAISALIDDELERVSPDGSTLSTSMFYALCDLRTAVARDVEARGLKLPDTVTHTPATTLPALVISHQLYGDALRDAEIISRNSIRSPGFVPGGTALEVLSE